MEEIITPSQVAAVLLVNVKTVYRLAKKGAIPDNKFGRCWRFIKKDFLDLVSNGQRKRLKDLSDRGHAVVAVRAKIMVTGPAERGKCRLERWVI